MENVIREAYSRLLSEYGPQDWWPAETPFEVCVGAILTQQTSWRNVENAIENLRKNCLLSCEAIARASSSEIERHIFSTGFYRQKALRLKNFCAYLCEGYGCSEKSILSKPMEIARDELLTLGGIGQETADSMLLYAGEHPIFVVDAYTTRILSRLTGAEHSDYASVQKIFHHVISPDKHVYREYHALIVEHGKRVCHKRDPQCHNCTLGSICFFFQNYP